MLPPVLQSFLDFLFHTLLGGFVVALGRAEIILRHEMVFAVVCVLVAHAVAEGLRAFVVAVAQMFRHGERAAGFHVGERGINGGDGGVALVGGGDVDGRLGNRDARLRPADEFGGLMRGVGEHERHRVGQAHVFGGADHDAARDEARVFAGVDHLGEPVERGVGVAAAHGFYEGGDGAAEGRCAADTGDDEFDGDV